MNQISSLQFLAYSVMLLWIFLGIWIINKRIKLAIKEYKEDKAIDAFIEEMAQRVDQEDFDRYCAYYLNVSIDFDDPLYHLIKYAYEENLTNFIDIDEINNTYKKKRG